MRAGGGFGGSFLKVGGTCRGSMVQKAAARPPLFLMEIDGRAGSQDSVGAGAPGLCFQLCRGQGHTPGLWLCRKKGLCLELAAPAWAWGHGHHEHTGAGLSPVHTQSTRMCFPSCATRWGPRIMPGTWQPLQLPRAEILVPGSMPH